MDSALHTAVRFLRINIRRPEKPIFSTLFQVGGDVANVRCTHRSFSIIY